VQNNPDSDISSEKKKGLRFLTQLVEQGRVALEHPAKTIDCAVFTNHDHRVKSDDIN
jgi:hypothetical protein